MRDAAYELKGKKVRGWPATMRLQSCTIILQKIETERQRHGGPRMTQEFLIKKNKPGPGPSPGPVNRLYRLKSRSAVFKGLLS